MDAHKTILKEIEENNERNFYIYYIWNSIKRNCV